MFDFLNTHTLGSILLALIVTAMIACVVYAYRRRRDQMRRAAYITSYAFPKELAAKVGAKYPALTDGEIKQVLEGLRQFFLACLKSEGHRFARHVGMPSVAVDEAWHEFILMTRKYEDFCTQAFGRYLHHAPAGQTEEPEEKSLANTLYQLRSSCPDPAANWAMLGTVPLIFALDKQLGIPGGHYFEPDEMDELDAKRRFLAALSGGDGGGSVAAITSGGGHSSCDSGTAGAGCDSGASSCGGSSCGGGGGCGSS
jgi:hypothetical protein